MTGVEELFGVDATTSAEEAIRAQMRPLLGYFMRRVEPREEAADCLSETLLVLWRRRRELPADEDAMRAWSFGVAKGVLANHRRGVLRRRALADRVRGELLVSQPIQQELDQELHDALGALGDIDRELVMLVAWDGFGVAEAGAVFGLSADAARARYSRARARLRALL